MAIFNLSSPWIIWYREIEELFRYDSDVHVVYDEDENHIKLYVDTASKADALDKLLPNEKSFGNVVVKISVIPANGMRELPGNLYAIAFENNGAFSFVKQIKGIFANNLTYVVFRNRVVQYWCDNLGDIYGQTSTLYQEIARDVFGETEGVFFCTDREEPVYESRTIMNNSFNAPLGEWP